MKLLYQIFLNFTFFWIGWCGLTFISGDDSDDAGHCETATSCNGLIVTIFSFAISLSGVRNTLKDVLAIGITGSQALAAFTSWQSGIGFTADIVSTDNEINNVDFTNYKVVYMPSSSSATSGGISCSHLSLIAARSGDLISFVNTNKGSLITLTQDGCASGYTYLAVPLQSTSVSISTVTIQSALSSVVTTLTPTSLNHCCYHTAYPGPAGYGGLDILAVDPISGYPIILGGWNVILTAELCHDGIDNDNDGLIDLADPDCNERFCADGIDNNGNGLIDCEDPACQSSWPPCLRELQLLGLEPQRNCQGSLNIINDTVICNQIGRGQISFNFYKYPYENITIGGVSIINPNQTIQSIVITGKNSTEDTMYNCGFDLMKNYDNSLFLFTSNGIANPSQEVARHSYSPHTIPHQTPYYMIQKYKVLLSELYNKTIKSILLFQKGQFGNGTAFIYPAKSNWYENTTCHNLISSGQSIYHETCYDTGPVQIIHQYGWSYVNITNLFLCQFNYYLNTSYSTIESITFMNLPEEMIIPLSYIWMEDSQTIMKQSWYSSESLYSPFLLFFYEKNNTSTSGSMK